MQGSPFPYYNIPSNNRELQRTSHKTEIGNNYITMSKNDTLNKRDHI